MALFESTELRKKDSFVIDNRLIPEELEFLVYFLGTESIKVALTQKQPYVQFQSFKMSIINDQLYINGDQLSPGLHQWQEQWILIISRENAKTHYFTLDKNVICQIHSSEMADIRIGKNNHYIIDGDELIVQAMDEFAYVNQKKLEKNQRLTFHVGDVLLTPYFQLERCDKHWRLNTFTKDYSFHQEVIFPQLGDKQLFKQFPDYSRKPRLNLEIPKVSFTIHAIENAPNHQKNGLLKAIVPPLAMIAMTVLTTMLSGRNPMMMLTMGTMSVVTVAFSISQYITDKKEQKTEKIRRESDYQRYLVKTVGELVDAYEKESEILHYRHPSPKELISQIKEHSNRIYERQSYNKDFLEVSFGLGDTTGKLKVKSDVNPRDLSASADELRRLERQFSTQRDVPIPVSLREQAVGLIATRENASSFLESLLFQVAFFHSYHDVNFVSLVSRKDYQETWKKWRLLPHFKMQDLNVRGLIHSNQSRDVVLNGLYQILIKRKQALQEAGREKPQFLPHYILSILDASYLIGHNLNELLAEDMSELGVTIIWSKETANQLPETVTTLVELPNAQYGRLVTQDNVYIQKDFKLYPKDKNLETSIRNLSNLHYVEIEKNTIPESLGLLEQYEVQSVSELAVARRWAEAEPNKSIRSLIGWRGKADYVYWDLHERAHGPHALVGGTTGSGKSEFLTTYLLGLAIAFSPEDIGMLIIDWKGGGIANTLDELPHFMGAITNLDGAGTARALASIKAELDKRQREFAKYGVNNINGYMSLYKQRHTPKPDITYPQKPLPHLILVSDEFAELKSNVPEFLDELTSVARIGRSLGVHLILATQKPTGVVNDQIEANSTSKIALKMANIQDSNELLKTPDAAHITNPGRGYLKVGQNEVYDLFQSGYAGLPYDPDNIEIEAVDERIFKINELGQYELIYDPGEEVQQGRDTSELPTQLEAVIEEINRVFKETNLPQPEHPWLPNLEQHIESPMVKTQSNRNVRIPLGMMDLPDQQLQKNFDFDLEKRGHTAVFSSPGYGKSTVLQTIALNMARANTPETVQMHLLDFGNNGLLPLRNLPHVSDIVMLEDNEKLQKMLQRITDEMVHRKSIFKEMGVASLSQYEAKTGKHLPIILHFLDNYDGLAVEDKRKDKIDGLLLQLLRDGTSLGLYLILSANRSGSVRMNMMSNISTKIALYLNDEAELSTLINKDRVSQEAIPGRGQMMLDVPRAIQFYQPAKGETSAEILRNLENIVEEMDAAWQGERPKSIPMVPERFTRADFAGYVQERDPLMIYMGLNKYSVEVETVKLFQGRHIGFFTESQRQLRLVFAHFYDQIVSETDELDLVLIDAHGGLEAYRQEIPLYIGRTDLMNGGSDLRVAVEALQTATARRRLIIVNGLSDMIEKLIYSPDDVARWLSVSQEHTQWIFMDSMAKIGNTFGSLTATVKEFVPELFFGGSLQNQHFAEQVTMEERKEVFRYNVLHRLQEESLTHIVVPEEDVT